MNPDYRDMLFALCDANADFLIVGAFALAAHGLPRATGDIDLWVRPTEENAHRVWRALLKFGAPLSQVTPQDFVLPDVVFQMGVAPHRIDLLTSIDGVDFDSAWFNKHEVSIEGRTMWVLGRTDLLRNKKSTGRPKDLADVAWLEATEGKS